MPFYFDNGPEIDMSELGHVHTQCEGCGYEMDLDSRYEPLNRKYCDECMSRENKYQNGEWD